MRIGMRSFHMDALSGDDTLAIERYRERKEQIQNHDGKEDTSVYLSCMESWNHVRDVLSYEERYFISPLAEALEQQYTAKEIKIEDVENICILADAWIGLEEFARSVSWYEKARCLVKEQLGEEHLLYADTLVAYRAKILSTGNSGVSRKENGIFCKRQGGSDTAGFCISRSVKVCGGIGNL